MKKDLSIIWKLILFRGFLAIVFGLLAVFLPAQTFSTIIMWLGAWLVINGVLMSIAAFQQKSDDKNWWITLVAGLASVAIGAYTFMKPQVTGAAIIIYLALWSILIGIAEIIFAIRIRKVIRGEGWLIAGGVISVLFGLLLLANPISGAITLTLILGIYALIFGIFLVVLALRIRKL